MTTCCCDVEAVVQPCGPCRMDGHVDCVGPFGPLDNTERDSLIQACGELRRAHDYWESRCVTAEQERDELDRRLRDSEERRLDLERMYSGAVADAALARSQAATAGAAAEALKGNR